MEYDNYILPNNHFQRLSRLDPVQGVIQGAATQATS